jgi:hypothetical protein
MQTRRSFFSRLGALVAVVAMAPEIAFSAKLDVQPKLDLQQLMDNFYAIVRARSNQPQIEIWTDNAGLDALYAMTGKAPESIFFDVPDMTKFGKVTGVYEPLGIYEQLRECRRV